MIVLFFNLTKKDVCLFLCRHHSGTRVCARKDFLIQEALLMDIVAKYGGSLLLWFAVIKLFILYFYYDEWWRIFSPSMLEYRRLHESVKTSRNLVMTGILVVVLICLSKLVWVCLQICTLLAAWDENVFFVSHAVWVCLQIGWLHPMLSCSLQHQRLSLTF